MEAIVLKEKKNEFALCMEDLKAFWTNLRKVE